MVKKVKNSQDLIDTVADIEPGQKIKAKVLRGEKKITVDIIITENLMKNK